MNRIMTTLAVLTAAATVSGAPRPQEGTGETGGYTLVWQDLFDNVGPVDPRFWNIEVGENGGANHELQYYTDRPENVRVGDDGCGNSCLILTARREDYGGRKFTSGRITTCSKFGYTHGKLEASIRLPRTANGLWPAFWTMGDDIRHIGWPRCGETDILEMGHGDGILAGTTDRLFNGALHWANADGSHAQMSGVSTSDYSLQDGEYHLFTLLWDESTIRMYVDLDRNPDARPYLTADISKGDMADQFHKPNFILFNLAVGGDFPGIHSPEGITALNDSNNQEASMYVDYVRVYRLDPALTSLNSEK